MLVNRYQHSFDFAAKSSKQQQGMAQRIWLCGSNFLMKTATSNSSNLPIIITGYDNNVLYLLFLSKLSFKRETLAKIGRATVLKLSLYKPILSPCTYFNT